MTPTHPFTTEEQRGAVSREDGKGPETKRNTYGGHTTRLRPDATVNADWLLRVFNELLRKQTFSSEWKTARAVLIPKKGRDPGEPISYRPLCLLSTISKTYEFLIRARLESVLNEKGGLAEHQYGFRRGR